MSLTLLEKIKMDRLVALKAKDSVTLSLLSTLLGEAEKVGKDKGNRPSTDEEVVAVIKKFVSNNEATIGMLADPNKSAHLVAENLILKTFLPKQLSLTDLALALNTITGVRGSKPSMGEWMGVLKANHPGQYDGKMAKQVWDAA